jgi:hypothetical protein
VNPSSRDDAEDKRVLAILVGAATGLREAARLNGRGRKWRESMEKGGNRTAYTIARAVGHWNLVLPARRHLGHLAHGEALYASAGGDDIRYSPTQRGGEDTGIVRISGCENFAIVSEADSYKHETIRSLRAGATALPHEASHPVAG